MKEEILRRYRSLLRRAAWVRAWDAFLETAFVTMLAAAALVLADRLAFELGVLQTALSTASVVLGLLGGGLAVALAAAVGAAGFARTSPARIAWAADQSLQTEALFLSAVELAQKPSGSEFDALVLERAANEAGRIEPRRVVPAPPLRHRWAIALALAAGAALLLLPPDSVPAPIADFACGPVRGPAPLTVRLEETCIGHIDSYEWDLGDGTAVRGRLIHHRYDEPGIYTVRLRVTGPGGEDTVERRTVEVVARDYVVADFVATPEKGRAPLTVAFRNLSSRADRCRWSFGDGTVSELREPVHTFERPGLYTVTLEAEGGGAVDRAEGRVKVVGPDAPLAEFAAHPTRGPEPLTVRFENRSTGRITGFEWDFGDPLADPSSEADPVHEYIQPGTYTVKLVARGPGGEDVEVKKHYIRVGEGESGGGGGGGSAGGGAGLESPRPLLERKADRPDVDPIPEIVRVPGGDPLVDKVKDVYADRGEGRGGGEEPYRPEVFNRYRRAAEEALGRETIPEPVRDSVRKYFEAIRPE